MAENKTAIDVDDEELAMINNYRAEMAYHENIARHDEAAKRALEAKAAMSIPEMRVPDPEPIPPIEVSFQKKVRDFGISLAIQRDEDARRVIEAFTKKYNGTLERLNRLEKRFDEHEKMSIARGNDFAEQVRALHTAVDVLANTPGHPLASRCDLPEGLPASVLAMIVTRMESGADLNDSQRNRLILAIRHAYGPAV